MVATKDRLAASASPQTCCTNCNTVFEIPQELLTSQDTRVRCGECLCIFDAMDGLSLPGPQPTPETRLEDEVSSLGDSGFSDLDVTYSDFDLFSDDAELPEVAYLDETKDAEDLDFGAVDTSNDRTFSDTMFHHDVTINADIPIAASTAESTSENASESAEPAPSDDRVEVETDPPEAPDALLSQLANVKYPVEPQVPEQPLVFDYAEDENPLAAADTELDDPPFDHELPLSREHRADSLSHSAAVAEPVVLQPPQPQGGRIGPWLLMSAMVLSLAVLLGGLYAYQERDNLGNNPRTRPLMAAACWLFRCDLPAYFDADQLRVLGRHVYTHPDIDGALVVNVVFRNEAEVDQRYPVLVIKLSDISGKLVASRNFQPVEYLSDAMLDQSAAMAAKTSLDISLEIRDPGANASSFEMEFR